MLRSALGERRKGKEKFIETVRGHGYRFTADVKIVRQTERKDGQLGSIKVSDPSVAPVSRPLVSKSLGNVVAIAAWQGASASAQHRDPPISSQGSFSNRSDSVEGAFPAPRILVAYAAVGIGILFVAAITWGLFRQASEVVAGVSSPPIDSIAVLPFENVDDDQQTEYLCDGIAESVINHLSQLPALRVVSRSSTFRYKSRAVDPQAVGRELNVNAVLSGTLRRVGENVVVAVRLDDSRTDQQIWGQQYIRPLTDMLSVQAAISRAVALNLSRRFSSEDLKALDVLETTNPEVYELYVRGRYFWNKRNKADVQKAIENFSNAVKLEPAFALGYVGLADSYLFLWEFADGERDEMLPKAEAAVASALSINESLAEGHATASFINRLRWKWPQSEAASLRSITLNPNYATARIWFSIYNRARRNFPESLNQMKVAAELDPLSPVVGANLAYAFILAGDPASAIEQCGRRLEIEPRSALLHELRGIAYLKTGTPQQAIQDFERAVELSGHESSRYLSSLASAYALSGDTTRSNKLLTQLIGRQARSKASGHHIAGVYASLGDTDRAMEWLEKDFERRAAWLPEINWRFAFDGMRSDPRFTDLIHRMHLE